MWSMKETRAAAARGAKVPPTYFSITESSLELLNPLPPPPHRPDSHPHNHVFSLNTAGSNRLLFSCPNEHELVRWTTALRLASWERSRLEEMYTGHLIRAYGVGQSLARGRYEGWVRIRVMGGTEWHRLWLVLSDPSNMSGDGETRRASLFGLNKHEEVQEPNTGVPMASFYNEPRTVKNKTSSLPVLTMTSVTQVYAVFPERVEVVQQSNLMKIVGRVSGSLIAVEGGLRDSGWALIMPEAATDDFGASHTPALPVTNMLRWIVAFHDAFRLHNRPGPYIWDENDPRNLFFAYPHGDLRGDLFLNVDEAAVANYRLNTPGIRAQFASILQRRIKYENKYAADPRDGSGPQWQPQTPEESSTASSPAPAAAAAGAVGATVAAGAAAAGLQGRAENAQQQQYDKRRQFTGRLYDLNNQQRQGVPPPNPQLQQQLQQQHQRQQSQSQCQPQSQDDQFLLPPLAFSDMSPIDGTRSLSTITEGDSARPPQRRAEHQAHRREASIPPEFPSSAAGAVVATAGANAGTTAAATAAAAAAAGANKRMNTFGSDADDLAHPAAINWGSALGLRESPTAGAVALRSGSGSDPGSAMSPLREPLSPSGIASPLAANEQLATLANSPSLGDHGRQASLSGKPASPPKGPAPGPVRTASNSGISTSARTPPATSPSARTPGTSGAPASSPGSGSAYSSPPPPSSFNHKSLVGAATAAAAVGVGAGAVAASSRSHSRQNSTGSNSGEVLQPKPTRMSMHEQTGGLRDEPAAMYLMNMVGDAPAPAALQQPAVHAPPVQSVKQAVRSDDVAVAATSTPGGSTSSVAKTHGSSPTGGQAGHTGTPLDRTIVPGPVQHRSGPETGSTSPTASTATTTTSQQQQQYQQQQQQQYHNDSFSTVVTSPASAVPTAAAVSPPAQVVRRPSGARALHSNSSHSHSSRIADAADRRTNSNGSRTSEPSLSQSQQSQSQTQQQPLSPSTSHSQPQFQPQLVQSPQSTIDEKQATTRKMTSSDFGDASAFLSYADRPASPPPPASARAPDARAPSSTSTFSAPVAAPAAGAAVAAGAAGAAAAAAIPEVRSSFAPSKAASDRRARASAQAAQRNTVMNVPGGGRRANKSMGTAPTGPQDWSGSESDESDDEQDQHHRAYKPPARQSYYNAGNGNGNGNNYGNNNNNNNNGVGAYAGSQSHSQSHGQYINNGTFYGAGPGQSHSPVPQITVEHRGSRALPPVPPNAPHARYDGSDRNSGADYYYDSSVAAGMNNLSIGGGSQPGRPRSRSPPAPHRHLPEKPQATGPPPPAARTNVWNANFAVEHGMNDQRKGTFVQLDEPATLIKAFTPGGLLSAGLQDKEDRSAKRQEEVARETGTSLINVPAKPPPPSTGLMGAVAAHEADRRNAGGIGATLTDRDRERRIAEERQRKIDELQRQQGQFPGGPGMFPAYPQYPMPTGGMPGMGPMGYNVSPNRINLLSSHRVFADLQPYAQAMMAAQMAYQQTIMAMSAAGSQMGDNATQDGRNSPSGSVRAASPFGGPYPGYPMSMYGFPQFGMPGMGMPPGGSPMAGPMPMPGMQGMPQGMPMGSPQMMGMPGMMPMMAQQAQGPPGQGMPGWQTPPGIRSSMMEHTGSGTGSDREDRHANAS
jgi:CCR4-NOT transcriptional complex subunit CAF120